MRLGAKQELFSLNWGHLILFAYSHGYKIRHGEVLRTQEQAEWNSRDGSGISNSLHILKLAGDMNVFKDKKWLKQSHQLKELGTFWKSLHPLCCWGGDFEDPDGGHFSITHRGVK